jgi:hypothetical protein
MSEMELGGGATPGIDVIRGRWCRWRERERLLDPEREDFGQGGLARLIVDRASRLLVLPADPEAHVVDLDDDLWAWWGSDFDDPATGGQTRWGFDKVPTAGAAVFGNNYGEAGWMHYIALHRSGALEVGLGRDGSFERNDRRLFFLSTIVGRCWAAFARYNEVISRLDVSPPYEVVLALCATEGALLGNVAEGWAEPGTPWNEADACPEPNILIRRELQAWPEGADEIKALTFSLGAQVEDAWRVTQRRFLAHRGDYEGQFDPRVANWH